MQRETLSNNSTFATLFHLSYQRTQGLFSTTLPFALLIIIYLYLYTTPDTVIMNESKLQRDRKHSLNKIPSQRSSTTSFQTAQQQMANRVSSQGQYLIGWGCLPHLQSSGTLANNIVQCAVGQQHLIAITANDQVYGLGSSAFGQLGIYSKQSMGLTQLLSKKKAKKAFCTNFSSFLLTQSQQLFGAGLNNRHQLGMDSNANAYQFIKLQQLSRSSLSSQNSRLRGLKYHPQSEQLPKQITQNKIKCVSLLRQKEYIRDIVGGPYHTLVLTSKQRILYSGNLYKEKSIQGKECIRSFTELSVEKASMVVSSITCFAFVAEGTKAYLMGLVSEDLLYEQPIKVFREQSIEYIGLTLTEVYGLSRAGDLFVAPLRSVSAAKKMISSIRQLHCGWDYCLVVNGKGVMYGRGVNSMQQLSTTKQEIKQFMVVEYVKQCVVNKIVCGSDYVVVLSAQVVINSQETSALCTPLKQYNGGDRQNKKLLKAARTQTDGTRFEVCELNARTFAPSLQISFEELQMGKQISQGGYGVIYEATWRKTTVAVKLFKISHDGGVRDFASECHAMEALRHPNIVQFLGACTKGPHYAIVLQYCEGGNLWCLLQKSGLQLSWAGRKVIAIQIARAMNYLHARATPVLHRDLKSLNVLLDCNGHVKLADFGWTKGLDNYMTGKIGTYQWMAPEVIAAQQYTEKADVYSFGIILWEIASREPPHRNVPGIQVAHDVVQNDLRPTVPKKTPESLVKLMKMCWDKDPSARPSFSTIIQELQSMSL